MKNNHHRGFTLVELLIAITIIAILSTLGFSVFKSSLARARDSKRMDDLKQIQLALEVYHNKSGFYPSTDWVLSSTGNFWIPGLDSTYLPKMPVDPKVSSACQPWSSNTCFNYAYYSSDGFCNLNTKVDSYILVARLEAHSGSDLSKPPFYKSDGSSCGEWDPDVPESLRDGLYAVRGP